MTTVFLRDSASGQILFDANGYPQIDTSTANYNNYGALKTRIGNEVLGAVTNDDVATAVQDAIDEYQRQDFWFSEMRYFAAPGSSSALTTVPGKEFYAQGDLPTLPNWAHISKVMVLAFGNRFALRERTPQWIDDQSISPTWQGLPTDWSWSSGALRLYPIPNGSYPLIMEGTVRFAPLVNDTDWNPWTDEARHLIRYAAKRRLFADIDRDVDQMQIAAAAEQQELRTLRGESFRRTGGPGRIRPSRMV